MTTENTPPVETSPVVPPEVTPPVAVTETPPAVAGGETPPTGEVTPPAAETPPTETPPKKAWYTQRIDEITRNLRETERQKMEIEAELHRLKGTSTTPPPDPNAQTFTQAEVEARAGQLANQRVAEQLYLDKCNAVYTAGKNAHPDFDQSLQQWNQVGGLTQPIIEAALVLPNPAEALYHLGKNLDKAAEIRSLPPVQQAAALVMFAQTLKPIGAPAPSGAPAPIKPQVGVNHGGGDGLRDDMPMSEWYAARQAQLQAKQRA